MLFCVYKKTLVKICELVNVPITFNNLRCTFTSITESNGISGLRLKYMLNQLTDKSDLKKAGYININS
ncbi:hypothetical protein N483_10860 [Pseudoalteromonas luteoviolacea NCIMB 1944]|nr:hypothetical protein N483_10860 [Pseudoalteromonas luteoviolacea NCIMB 1944]